MDGREHGAEDWFDVTVPLFPGMTHWPSDPPLRIESKRDMSRGDSVNATQLFMGAHSGTHMDAPVHFLQDGAGIDEMPLSVGIGKARVIEIADPVCVRAEELRRHSIERDDRLLLKTRNSDGRWYEREFDERFVFLSLEAAELVAEIGIRLVGIDYLSIGGYKGRGHETHRSLMRADVWILEGLDLGSVEPGVYDMICLPLRVAANDGAPARVILRRSTG